VREGAPDLGKLMLEAGDLGFERHIGFPWFCIGKIVKQATRA
jgi:hypothetical protein